MNFRQFNGVYLLSIAVNNNQIKKKGTVGILNNYL